MAPLLTKEPGHDVSEEARDDHGRWTAGGFSEEAATHEVRLQREAKEGIAKVDALLNDALATADFESVAHSTWESLDDSARGETEDKWVEENIDAYEESAFENESSNAAEYVRENSAEEIQAAALDKWNDTTAALNINPETVSFEEATSWRDKGPILVASLLRTNDGQELNEQQTSDANRLWRIAYGRAVDDAVEAHMDLDSTRDSISEQARRDASDHFAEMSDSDKFAYAERYGFAKADVPPGLPNKWMWDSGNDYGESDYGRTRAIAVRLAEMRTGQLFAERGLSVTGGLGPDDKYAGTVASAVWDSWKDSSTSNMGLALQYAAAEELGGVHRMTPKEIRMAMGAAENLVGHREVLGDASVLNPHAMMNSETAQKLGMDRLKAYVRAQWETSQYVLSKAGTSEVDVYRGLMLAGKDIEGVAREQIETNSTYRGGKYERLSDIKLLRNGAASTSAKPSVANDWGGIASVRPPDAVRVVLRVHAPATAVLSLPVFGQNVHEESEVVLAGTKGAWKWDAFLRQAPPASAVAIKWADVMEKSKTLVIDLLDIDRGKPHWLSRPKKNKAFDESQPRDEHGRWTNGNLTLLTLREHVTPKEFIDARAGSTRSGYLSPLTPDDLEGSKLWLDAKGQVGGALTPDGDMTNLFNNGGPKGAAAEVLMDMLDHGGKTADAFDGYLPTLYANFGLEEVGRMKFNRDYAPEGWNYDRDGEPDVVFLAKLKDVPHDVIRTRVFGPKSGWVPPTHTGTYYEDYDQAKHDATARANLRGKGHSGRRGQEPRAGMDGQARRDDSGAGSRVRRPVTFLAHAWFWILKRAGVDHEPDLQQTLREAWKAAVRGVSMTEVRAGVREKDWDKVATALQRTHPEAAIEPRLAAAFLRGASHAQESLVRAKKAPLRAMLGRINPKAKRWAKERAGELVVGSDVLRETVRSIVDEAIKDGLTVDDTADLLRDVVGLDPRRAGAAANYARDLHQQGVGGADLWRQVTRYTDELRASRAETIARTEVLMATNAGQHALWDEAAKHGHLDGMARVWIATQGCCDDCEQLELDSGAEPVPFDEPFDGDVMFPPLHPNCRCAVGLVNDEN